MHFLPEPWGCRDDIAHRKTGDAFHRGGVHFQGAAVIRRRSDQRDIKRDGPVSETEAEDG